MTAVALRDVIEPSRFGGKAVELGAAIRAGLPVPEGVALAVELVAEVVGGSPRARSVVSGLHATLGGSVAVRSSAVGEDSATASFAGQHATILNVASESGLVEAVCAVHASGHADAALAYRARAGVPGAPRIAVVVQRLVHAHAAGVLFTRDPVTGRDERVIESAWGLGEIVVAGLVNPDRYRIDRTGKIVERTIGCKDVMIVPRPGGGTEEISVADDRARTGLTDAQLAELDQLAARCEAAFGPAGHDIEWAFGDDGRVHLLQRRPITRKL
ncbi:MAG: PEP/pyruvate-binding domain-containing protein [Kofleriaceae bacterium]